MINKIEIKSINDLPENLTNMLYKNYFQCNAFTKNSMKYRSKIANGHQYTVKCNSFLYFFEKKCVAALIGNYITKEGHIEFSGIEGRPFISILDEQLMNKNIKKYIVNDIKEMINRGIKIKYRDNLTQNKLSIISTFLLHQGLSLETHLTQVINLQSNISQLKNELRKSYKSLINWGKRELEINIISSQNISKQDILNFKELHIQEAGRQTRSDSSWDAQFLMVKNDDAFLINGIYETKLVTVGFFPKSKFSCYYGASATNRLHLDKPIFHNILWSAIIHSKQIGLKWFDLGEQKYNCSQKESNISLFKSGFGGNPIVFADFK